MNSLIKSVLALLLIASMITMVACNAVDKTINDSNQVGDTSQEENIVAVSKGLEYEVNSDGKSCSIVGLGTCTDTDIVVGESIDGYKITSIGKIGVYPFKDCENIKSVTLSDGVTEIQSKSFSGCTSLQYVKLPDSIMFIYSYAFENCSSLKDVELPKSLEYIDKFAFYGCSSIESIEIPASVDSVRSCAFEG